MHDSNQRRYQQNPPNPKQDDDCGCEEKDTATQKSINKERVTYCTHLSDAGAAVLQFQEKKNGLTDLYDHKKCWFLWTEKNYRIYRNLELEVGAELIQTTDSIKDNVSNYLKLNKKLGDGLKKVSASLKDIKSKVTDLRNAACSLKMCMEEPCNCTQMIILTGNTPPQCKEQPNLPRPEKLPEACLGEKDINKNLEKLVCMPKALFTDINYIYNSAVDVTGIQTFSNIDTLDPLQKELNESAKSFDKQIQDTIKTREGDLKKALDELTATGKDLAKSKVELYSKRSDFEGIQDAVEFFCCTKCDCLQGASEDGCTARLEKCKCDICKICDEVKDTFCKDSQSTNQDEC